MKKIFSISILIILLSISGCVTTELTERIYACDGDTITLSTDHTYKWTDIEHDYVWTGTYQEDENTVIIILDSPLPSIEMKKVGTNLTFRKDVWVLQ